MLLSRHRNAGKNDDMKIANRSFENMTQSEYWEDSKNSKFNLVKMKRRLNSGNAY
jgi:hypothetical protein